MQNILKNKNTTYLIPGFFGLAILCVAVFLDWQLFSSVQNDSTNLASIKKDSLVLEMQNTQIQNFKNKYPEYASNLAKMDQEFIDPKNPVNFIEFLENTASEAQITSKISLVPDADKNATAFELSLTANFLNILHFSEKLQHGPYLVEIESMEIKNQQGADPKNLAPGQVDARLLIKAFAKQQL